MYIFIIGSKKGTAVACCVGLRYICSIGLLITIMAIVQFIVPMLSRYLWNINKNIDTNLIWFNYYIYGKKNCICKTYQLQNIIQEQFLIQYLGP